jgi:hypothetical protein
VPMNGMRRNLRVGNRPALLSSDVPANRSRVLSQARSGVALFCLLWLTSCLPGQQASPSDALRWTVRPGAEAGVLVSSTRSRLEGNHRLIGRRGMVRYGFRVLSGMDVQIQLTAGGSGHVRLRVGEQGLMLYPIRGQVRTHTLTTRTPLQPSLQQLEVSIEAGRRGRIALYGLNLKATQRDEDGDGIGDSTERLLGAPASALNPHRLEMIAAPAVHVSETLVNTPIPIGGEYQADPFARMFLYCGALLGAQSGIRPPIPIGIESMHGLLTSDLREHQHVYFSTLIAALMFPSVHPVISTPSQAGTDYAAILLSALQAAESMAEHADTTLDAGMEGIGVLWSESQDPSGRWNLTSHEQLAVAMPLVRAGIPVQPISPLRLTTPDALSRLRLLIWTAEAVSLPNEPGLSVLVDWVRRGGWLLIIGAPPAPQHATPSPEAASLPALAAKLGLNLKLSDLSDKSDMSDMLDAPHAARWQEMARHGNQPERGTLNRRWVEIDLSPYGGQTVYLRFSDSLPDTGWGARLRQVRLETEGRALTAFYPGTGVERLFLYAHSRSLLTRAGERVADGDAWFVYRFALPRAPRLVLRAELAQEWRVELSLQPPYAERVLVRQRTDLPALTLRHDERLMACEIAGAETLYLYTPLGERASSPATLGVLQTVGRGGIVLLGFSARAFGNSPNGETQLRQLIRFVVGRTSQRYRERSRFTMRRGDWVAAYGTSRTTLLRGTYLDVLDLRLPVLTDVSLEPRTPRLLLRVEERLKRPGLLHTNARQVLRHETANRLAYLLSGAEGIAGVARLSIRNLQGQVQLLDLWGRPVPVNVERSGETLLVRWNMGETGHVLIVR